MTMNRSDAQQPLHLACTCLGANEEQTMAPNQCSGGVL